MTDDKGQQHVFTEFIIVGAEDIGKDGATIIAMAKADGNLKVAKGLISGLDQIRESVVRNIVGQMRNEVLGDLQGLLKQMEKAGIHGRVVTKDDLPDFIKEMMERQGSGRRKDFDGPAFPHMRSTYRPDKQREYNRRAQHNRH